MNIAENRLPQDGRIKIRFGGKDIDIRVNSLPTQFGERIVMRLLNKTDQVFDISNIGFSESLMTEFTQTIKNSQMALFLSPDQLVPEKQLHCTLLLTF